MTSFWATPKCKKKWHPIFFSFTTCLYHISIKGLLLTRLCTRNDISALTKTKIWLIDWLINWFTKIIKITLFCLRIFFFKLNYTPLRSMKKLAKDYTVLSTRIKGIGILRSPICDYGFWAFFATLKIALTGIRTYA